MAYFLVISTVFPILCLFHHLIFPVKESNKKKRIYNSKLRKSHCITFPHRFKTQLVQLDVWIIIIRTNSMVKNRFLCHRCPLQTQLVSLGFKYCESDTDYLSNTEQLLVASGCLTDCCHKLVYIGYRLIGSQFISVAFRFSNFELCILSPL